MASEIHFDGQQFGLWPLALGESVAEKIHFDLQQIEPWGEMLISIYRSDRQQIDPVDPTILIANHPLRGGEISSPAIRPLDHWPLAARVHFPRQQFDHWRAKFVLSQQFDPWHPQNHFESL